jgi:hypothetical protein
MLTHLIGRHHLEEALPGEVHGGRQDGVGLRGPPDRPALQQCRSRAVGGRCFLGKCVGA